MHPFGVLKEASIKVTDNGIFLLGYPLPAEILVKIFSYLPPTCLIQTVNRICKHWYLLTQSWSLWKIQLTSQSIALSASRWERLALYWGEKPEVRCAAMWLCVCGEDIFNRNLLKNSSGQEGLKYWKVKRGGDGLLVEDPPIGSEPLPPQAGLPTQHCFVSSFITCRRQQRVRIAVPAPVLSVLRPQLVISEWVSARFDCGAVSRILVNANVGGYGRTSSTEFRLSWDDATHGRVAWHKVELRVSFEDLPAPLNSLMFSNESKDTQFWAGHYGAKTAGSSLLLDLAHEKPST